MIKSFLREVFDTKTTSCVFLFYFIEKILVVPEYTALTESSKSICYKLSCVLRFVIVFSLPIFSLLSICIEKNPQLRFDSLLSLAMGIHILTSYLFLWLLKNKREKLSRYVIETTSSQYTNNQQFMDIFEKYRIFSIKIMAGTIILHFVGGIAYITLPLFLLSDDWKLPVHSPIYGISYQNHPGYEINYLLIVLQSFISVCCCIVFHVLFYLYCSFTVALFELCKISCIYIGDKSGEYNTEERQQQLVQDVVKMHSDAVEFLKKFKSVFESVVLLIVTTLMGAICIAIVQIASDNQLSAYFGLLVAASQLLLYSYFGQMIISKREEFSEAIYCSKWYELKDTSTRKMVLLMLMNAQKCEGMHLKGSMELSLEEYCEMVKACYSFAAFLKNIM